MKQIVFFICVMFICTAYSETIQWWNNGQLYTSTSCEFGTDVNLPTNPTPQAGFVFAGWDVQTYDFSTFDIDSEVLNYWAKNKTNSCFKNNSSTTSCSSNVEFSDLGEFMWKTQFSWGYIYGDALCSNTESTLSSVGTPNNLIGYYCWCRAVGYKPQGSNIVYDPDSTSQWVFFYSISDSDSQCATYCPYHCGKAMRDYKDFRKSIFGQ